MVPVPTISVMASVMGLACGGEMSTASACRALGNGLG